MTLSLRTQCVTNRFQPILLLLALGLLFLSACMPTDPAVQEPSATAETDTSETATLPEATASTETMTDTDTITDTIAGTEMVTESETMSDGAGLPAEMVGVVWQWENREVDDPSLYTLEFASDGTVAVQADCNRGRGTYQLVGQAFFIEVLALTRAACPPGSLEQPFLEQVNSTDTYRLEGSSLVLTLRVAPGMMTLVPASELGEETGAETGESSMDGSADLSDVEQQLVENAIALVTDQVSIDATAITLSAIEAVEWSDSSLGCPQPDGMYMQVITPGYRIMLSGADGTRYAVHTGRQPDGPLVLCQDEEETPSEETTSEESSGDLTGLLTGSVAYRQRIALPPDSVITVELQDVSRADAPAEILASQTITTAGENVPIPFELTYDPAQIDERFTYAVRAEIMSEGQLIWTTAERYAALTNGAPMNYVMVILTPVQ